MMEKGAYRRGNEDHDAMEYMDSNSTSPMSSPQPTLLPQDGILSSTDVLVPVHDRRPIGPHSPIGYVYQQNDCDRILEQSHQNSDVHPSLASRNMSRRRRERVTSPNIGATGVTGKKTKVMTANDIPGYVGDQALDDILSYIGEKQVSPQNAAAKRPTNKKKPEKRTVTITQVSSANGRDPVARRPSVTATSDRSTESEAVATQKKPDPSDSHQNAKDVAASLLPAVVAQEPATSDCSSDQESDVSTTAWELDNDTTSHEDRNGGTTDILDTGIRHSSVVGIPSDNDLGFSFFFDGDEHARRNSATPPAFSENDGNSLTIRLSEGKTVSLRKVTGGGGLSDQRVAPNGPDQNTTKMMESLSKHWQDFVSGSKPVVYAPRRSHN